MIKKEEYKAALAAFAAAVASIYAAQYFWLIVFVVPIVLAYAVARGGYIAGGAAALLSFAAAAIFAPVFAAVCAAAFLPIAFAAGYAVRSKMRFRNAVILSAGAALAGAALLLAAPTMFWGISAVDYIVDSTGATMSYMGEEYVKQVYEIARYPDILTGAITQQAVDSTTSAEAIIKMQEILRDALNLWLVTFIGAYSILAGYLSYIGPRAYAKKQGLEVAAIPAFSEYMLPKRFWLFFALTYILARVGADYGWDGFETMAITVYNLFKLLFAAQALSLLDFIYKKRGMKATPRILLHALAALAMGTVIMWLGVIDNVAGLRKRMDERQA